ncbi:cell division protein PerM [Terrabacter sp. RAF57]|uniref:cell division protein PerM n=1 Tax=Terrabacter sp. RAF57 TaxID=3233063 RepID=UPI003F967AC9
MRPLAPPSTTTTSTTTSATSSTSPSTAMPAALRAGALAAVGTWSVVVLPALIGWVAAPESSVGWFSAVSVASSVWFLGHGQSVGAGPVAISMTPLLLLLVFVLIAYRFARRLAATERLRVGATDWSRVAQCVVPGFVIGYGLVSAVFALFTLGGPATPGVAAVVGSLLVPLAALGFVMLRPDDETAPAFVRTWFRRGPTWLPTVWRTGWRGAGVLLALGFVVVVVRLVASWSAVADIQDQYGANLGAIAIIALAQVALLGNAATWALSFLAGPGFQVALGSTISAGAAQPGLLPLVPVLGALPQASDYPATMYAVVLAPVLVGVWLGRRVDAELEFFGNVRARLSATAVAALVAVAVVVVLTALGNGAVGVDRLSAVGAHLWSFAAALTAEVVGGALLFTGVLVLRDRRAEQREREHQSGVATQAGADAETSAPDAD